VEVQIVREEKADKTFVSFATGTCSSCGATYDEAELLKLEGPGPVGG
jgi:hypothetical protein